MRYLIKTQESFKDQYWHFQILGDASKQMKTTGIDDFTFELEVDYVPLGIIGHECTITEIKE